MENSQPLATGSFSYSWLLNKKSSIVGPTESPRPSYSSEDDLDDDEGIKFISYSKRFLEEAQSFNFDVHPVFESVQVDEIFLDGHIMPLYLDRSKIESFQEAFNNFNTSSVSSSTPPTSISKFSDSTTIQADFGENGGNFLAESWPLPKRLASSRRSTAKVDDLQRKESEIQSCKSTTTDSSFQGSPRGMLKSYSVVDWDGNGDDQRNSSRRVKSLRKFKS
ncbi:hypothetical protein HAX54_030955 [Datura stramonium]|uniref:Uncharacterized protein n=1 Tax=Datura stramonium TaxID=4076 RepID=A0ABS8SBU8_DATST|nr:hypothetical protein [Datura stramonium]